MIAQIVQRIFGPVLNGLAANSEPVVAGQDATAFSELMGEQGDSRRASGEAGASLGKKLKAIHPQETGEDGKIPAMPQGVAPMTLPASLPVMAMGEEVKDGMGPPPQSHTGTNVGEGAIAPQTASQTGDTVQIAAAFAQAGLGGEAVSDAAQPNVETSGQSIAEAGATAHGIAPDAPDPLAFFAAAKGGQGAFILDTGGDGIQMNAVQPTAAQVSRSVDPPTGADMAIGFGQVDSPAPPSLPLDGAPSAVKAVTKQVPQRQTALISRFVNELPAGVPQPPNSDIGLGSMTRAETLDSAAPQSQPMGEVRLPSSAAALAPMQLPLGAKKPHVQVGNGPPRLDAENIATPDINLGQQLTSPTAREMAAQYVQPIAGQGAQYPANWAAQTAASDAQILTDVVDGSVSMESYPASFPSDFRQGGFSGLGAATPPASGAAVAGQFVPPSAISAQILPSLSKAQSGPVEILLSPAELGHLRFEIHHRGDEVQIVLAAQRPETLDLLRRNGDQLLNDFRSAGFTGASLSFGGWGAGQDQRAMAQDFGAGRQATPERVLTPLGEGPSAQNAAQNAAFLRPRSASDQQRSLNLRL